MELTWPLAFDFWSLGLAPQTALLIVAGLGFWVGRYSRTARLSKDLSHTQRELRRALLVAAELERINTDLCEGLARHTTDVQRFRERVGRLTGDEPQQAWKELCEQAEKILQPTLELGTRMTGAYEMLRQQSANLMEFSESRIDPLTRVANRRGLKENLLIQCGMARRYGTFFSVVLFDIDHFKAVNDQQGHLEGDHILQAVAGMLADSVRGGDMVARFGGEEFLAILPQTDLLGAATFADRMRQQIAQQLGVTVSAGVALALRSEDPDEILFRADKALYAAKDAGRNRVHLSTENQVVPFSAWQPAAVESAPLPDSAPLSELAPLPELESGLPIPLSLAAPSVPVASPVAAD